MCGIAGYVSWASPPDTTILQAMERSLRHRGPDEGSVWHDEYCGFAHRRLRVIDLSPLAAQPMPNETGQLRVIFNGEIYNFLELRAQLESLGHKFKSHSDTEVLVHGYESWKDGLFEKLRGMFALAIWDSREQRLTFARDRLGKKPFFYSTDGAAFVFGSELTVFKYAGGLSLSISPDVFREYIEFGYVHSPQTILREVRQLPPGHFGTWSRQGLALHRYWSIPDRPPPRDDAIGVRESAKMLEGPLREAVQCRLISDVPLGCFLSGGIDSSLVAANAQQLVNGRLRTYSVGFQNSQMNEASYAASVASYLGTDHHQVMIDPQTVIDEFENILSKASEPTGDDSFLPTFIISRETRREVTVALSGDGGDELFCGYAKYKQFCTARKLRRLVPRAVRRTGLVLIGSRGGDRISKALEAVAAPNDEGLARWLSTVWKRSEMGGLFDASLNGQTTTDSFSANWNRRIAFPPLERFMVTDMDSYMRDDILAKVDRASMAHGLEVRNPLLDQNFVGAAFQTACHARFGKVVLKEMLTKHLPLRLFERPKHGFGMPVNEWYRGPLRKLLTHYTSAERMKRRGLLNPETVQLFVASHLSGRRDFGRKLHLVVAFEIWADQFFGKDQALA